MLTTFGGNSITPAQVSYSVLAMSANTTLVWPDFVTDSQQNVVSMIMDISASVGSLALTMPDATLTGKGTTVLFNNVGSNTITIKDSQGNTLGTVSAGVVKFLYLTDNSTAAGSWRIFTFGTGSSSADAASLAGSGLQAIGSTLNQSLPYTSKASDWTITSSDLAKGFVLTTGSFACNLMAAATAGSNFFFFLKNGGSGTLTVNRAGADTIDGANSVQLAPGDACIVMCGGAANTWYTIGLGRNVNFAFTQLVKNVAGGVDVTLTSTEAANKIMSFTGLLTNNINVIVPNTASVYYTYNNTTGAFTLTVKTAAGTGVAIAQGSRDILICDATNVMQAQTNTVTSTAFGAGSAGAPSITFIGDTDTGIYHPAANQVGFTTNGTERLLLTDTGPQLSIDGSAANPALSFKSETTSGLYRIGANQMGVAIAGVLVAAFTATGIDSNTLRLKNVAAATALTDAPTAGQVQNGDLVILSAVAGTNTITGNATPAPTLKVGQRYGFYAAGTNTTATTLNISGLGAGAVQTAGAALVGGEIQSGMFNEVAISALGPTVFQLVSTGYTRPFTDAQPIMKNAADATKKLALDLSVITTGTTRTLIAPNANGTIVLDTFAQTLTNKTITAPVLGGTVTGTYTLGGTPTISSPTIVTPVINGTISGSAIAVQADMETATATNLIVPPGVVVHNPGVAKAWGVVITPTTVNACFPAGAVIGKNGTGDYTIQHNRTFSSANYVVNVIIIDSRTGTAITWKLLSTSTTQARILFLDTGGTPIDPDTGFEYSCLGDL